MLLEIKDRNSIFILLSILFSIDRIKGYVSIRNIYIHSARRVGLFLCLLSG